MVERFGLRAVLLAVAFVLVAVPFGVLLDQVVREGPLVDVDVAIAEDLHHGVRERPLLVDVLGVVTDLGSPATFYAACVPLAVVVAVTKRVRIAAFLAVSTLLGGAINLTVKHLVGRERPVFDEPVATAGGFSFPSGHALVSTVVYGTLLLIVLPLVPRRWRPVLVAGTVLLVLAIGFTRLALGVHYVSDVLGGFVLGSAWLLVVTVAFGVEAGRLRPSGDRSDPRP